MLDEAKAALERAMRVLGPRLEAGARVVVLEPGCLSVFRDELKQLFPGRPMAERLASQALSLAEFLKGKSPVKQAAHGRLLVHGHCHQKALWGMGADLELLRGAGCEVSAPDTGCCGMAGSFGYRPQFYEASKRIAELDVLPALRAAPGAAVVASGFSCREQIEGLSGRRTLHVAEVLAGGLEA
jgi:Fe-S oxidoreductase